MFLVSSHIWCQKIWNKFMIVKYVQEFQLILKLSTIFHTFIYMKIYLPVAYCVIFVKIQKIKIAFWTLHHLLQNEMQNKNSLTLWIHLSSGWFFMKFLEFESLQGFFFGKKGGFKQLNWRQCHRGISTSL